MALTTTTKYRILLYGGVDGFNKIRAQIFLASSAGSLGAVRFYDAAESLPEDGKDSSGKSIMNLPISMFRDVLDVLRNESPLSFSFYSSAGSVHAVLETGDEAVGEGELGQAVA